MTLSKAGWEALTYATAAFGAALAWSLNVPLAMIVGPVIAVSIVSQRLPKLRIARPLYALGLSVIGLALGQYFTPDVLNTWGEITGTLALNTGITLVGVVFGFLLLHKAYGHDRKTAALGGLPGGVLTVIEMARASSADTTSILFFQVFRIILGASVVPLGYSLAGFDVPASGVRPTAEHVPPTAHDLALLCVGGLALMIVGRRLRVPSAEISLPLVWSATLYASGWVTMTIPVWAAGAAFVVVGGSVGAMLPNLSLRRLCLLVVQSLGLFALLMCLALVAALLAWTVFDISLASAILAFSPASLTEMIAVAVALDLDPALVAANNMYRMLLCSLIAPLLPMAVMSFGRAKDRSA